ncbi:MAG: site-2 protease family protein [Nitrospinota bacterium]|nr:site-2 protease family protein [Nitrospinota bacterium]
MIYIGALLLVGSLVAIHEFGHFVAGRMMGVPIAVFSLGFGPRVAGFTWGETDVRLSLIPLGGYVLPAIEDEEDYLRLDVKARMLFSLGGPAANFLTAIFLIAMINGLSGNISAFQLLVAPVIQASEMFIFFIISIPMIFSQPQEVSSVVGMVSVGGQVMDAGLVAALKFAVIISLNLAIFNLLPLPPLDGGKIMLDTLEYLDPKLAKVYLPACVMGWVLLIGLMLYATANDIARLST